MLGADFIYFSGFSVNGYSGEVMTTEMFNQSLDLREKRIEKYMNTNLVMS
jgi:hypothetical protein